MGPFRAHQQLVLGRRDVVVRDAVELDLFGVGRQRGQIETILTEAREEMGKLRRELRPRMKEAADRTRARIDEVLSDEQLERLDEHLARRPMRRRSPPPED